MEILSHLNSLFEDEESRYKRILGEVVAEYDGVASLGKGPIANELEDAHRLEDRDFDSVAELLEKEKAVDVVARFPGEATIEAAEEVGKTARYSDEEEFDSFLDRYGSEGTKELMDKYSMVCAWIYDLRPGKDHIRDMASNLGSLARESLSWDEDGLYDEVVDTVRNYDDVRAASAVTAYLAQKSFERGEEEVSYDVDRLREYNVAKELEEIAPELEEIGDHRSGGTDYVERIKKVYKVVEGNTGEATPEEAEYSE